MSVIEKYIEFRKKNRQEWECEYEYSGDFEQEVRSLDDFHYILEFYVETFGTYEEKLVAALINERDSDINNTIRNEPTLRAMVSRNIKVLIDKGHIDILLSIYKTELRNQYIESIEKELDI